MLKVPVKYAAALCLFTAAAFTAAALAQAPSAPSFTVATIKPSDAPNPGGFMTFPAPGRLSAPNFPLQMLIGFAYSGEGAGLEVTGGPDWIRQDRYNVQAQAEGTPTQPELRLMLRTLLAERFGLKVHTDSKPIDVYEMVLARSDGKLGPKVEPFDGECVPGARVCQALINPNGFNIVGNTMGMVANLLSNRGGLGRRVVDKTGVTGRFTVKFEFPYGQANAKAAPDPLASEGVSIFTAVQEQIGVKLQPGKGTQPLLVVDSVARPTEN